MKRKKRKDVNLLHTIALGLLVTGLILSVGAAITSKLIIDEKLDVKYVSMSALIVLGTAVLAGCMVAGQITKEKKKIATVLTAAVFYCILLSVNTLACESNFGMLLPGTLTVLSGTTVSALIAARKKVGRGTKRIASTR